MSRATLLLILACAFAANRSLAETPADVARARQITGEALTARKAGDAAGYLARLQAAIAARPNMPGLMLRLAGAHAMNRQADQALILLEKLAAMGLAFNLDADADLAFLKDAPRFRAIEERMLANRLPLVRSSSAFELPEKDFLAEGIAHDPRTGNFYLASVFQRKIVKRLPSGNVVPFAGATDARLWGVLALAVDPRRRRLWATSAAMDQTLGIDAREIGRTAVFQFDLDRERLIARYELPDRGKKRAFGDLLLADNGDVYVSESIEGGIYRIAGDKLETFVAPGMFVSPQGMAWMDGGRWLYAADYALGLLRIDMQTRAVEWLPPPAGACLLGLDGMVRAGGTLIATQNGIHPHRVVQIALDARGQVTKVTPLEANHPRHSEPTLGVMVGNDFYYNANSQWELFEPGKPAPLDKLSAPLILRLPIDAQ